MTPLRAVKGMHDVLPDEISRWQRIEAIFARTMALYGYRELRTPYVEPTALFVRAIGEATDVVEKEMYSFVHHDEPLTLRPENTAGAARAFIEHAIGGKEPVSRWYYVGPMFRAERPQRGRYRQFYQCGAEVFGDPGAGCDAEMIDMLVAFLKGLVVPDLEVLVNSLGGPGARARHKDALVAYLEPRKAALTPDSQRRLATNPMRILDSKAPEDRAVLEGAPQITDFLDEADQKHFADLRRHLEALGTPHRIEPRLVRGLDYYTRTVFEIKGAKARLGAGDTLVGGGRYDNLVAELGGKATPALGFSAGLERLLEASELDVQPARIDAYVAPVGEKAVDDALILAREVRMAGIPCEADTRGTSLKSQLRRADALGARVVLILGDAEIEARTVMLKDLGGHTQEAVARDKVVPIVVDRLVAASRGIEGATRSPVPKGMP